jgi:hypothetical protein
METLSNWGMESVLITLKEFLLATLNVLPLFTLCSAHVSALDIGLSGSPCKRIRKWKTFQFWKRKYCYCAFSLSICDKKCTLLAVFRETVSKVMSAYMNHERTKSVYRNSGRKLTLIGLNRCTLRRTVKKNQSTTAAQVTAELNIHLIFIPQKLSDMSFTNPTSTVGLQLLNLWLL